MRWKIALLFAVSIATAASVHITIENDLHVDEPAGKVNGHTTTTTTTPTSTRTTSLADTAATVTATTDFSTTSVSTTESDKYTNSGSEESMTEVPDSEESTTIASPDDGILGSRSLEVAEGDNIVQITSGTVQGFQWNTNPGIIAYIDVPYGKFTGYFQEPTDPEPWESIHDAKEHNKRCPQLQDGAYVGDIDCLILSIFVPAGAENAGILFHIHESNFVSGSGDPSVYGPEYFVNKGVILILPNFRLGPLGFLCLQNATAPGNAALKDLTLALNWTKQNIAAFGGDPSNIVVSGDGTSGALAGYLALSPKSKHYVSKVITESGAVLSHWALDRNPNATKERLIEQIRQLSVYNNTFETANIDTIILASKNITIRPCLEHSDNPFLSTTPWTLLNITTSNVTFMIGSASHAGVQEAISLSETYIEQLNENFSSFLPNDLTFHSLEDMSTVGNRVKREYFGEHVISAQHIEEMSLCYTDAWYMGPAIRTARALVQAGATVFFYEFAFVGELNRELVALQSPINHTVRGDIVGYLFTQDGQQAEDNTYEKKMIDTMLNLWVTFIETGQPKLDDVEWTELSVTEDMKEPWLSIGVRVELRQGLHGDRMQLWTDIYDEHFIETQNLGHELHPNVYTALISSIVSYALYKMYNSKYIVG